MADRWEDDFDTTASLASEWGDEDEDVTTSRIGPSSGAMAEHLIKGSLARAVQNTSIGDTDKWEIDPSEVILGERLGKGAFGTVYRGKLRGKEVAVKKLNSQSLDEETLESFRKEVAIMAKLRHPNIILFMGACTKPGNLMIVTELMPKGSVYDLLHASGGDDLSFKRRMNMAKQAALGMNWLHCSKPVFIHRDLKTGNLLVDDNWTVKVCDFGLSHIKLHIDKGVRGNYGAIGTPLWMAPEVLMNKDYDESADVYGFGIVLWELITQQDPFPDISTFEDMVDQVCTDHRRPEIPPTCPKKLRQLITTCWDPTPGSRPTFDEIIPMFDAIIVESVISDVAGRLFWKKNFLKKGQLHDVVSWKTFVTSFCQFHKERVPKDPDDVRFKCLKALIADNKDNKVTMEAFGRMLEWFGPMKGYDILDSVVDLLKKSWFHGEISAQEAEKVIMKEAKKGTFLVRFSSRDPGCYAITGMSKGGRLKHFRVYHKPGLQYLIGKTECPSLSDIISRYHNELYLKSPCPGSQFEDIFKSPASSSISAGYMVPNLK